MAENNQRRSYRDPPRWRGAEEAPHAEADDPLAELARLIGQSVQMNKLGQDRTPAVRDSADDQRNEIEQAAGYRAAQEVDPEPTDDRYSVSQSWRDSNQGYRERSDHRYEPTARANPPTRVSRFRQEPDFAREARHAVGAETDAANAVAHEETAGWDDRSLPERDSHYPDEYDDEGYDAEDDAYGDEYSEDQNTGRRGGFIFVALVFGLAVLGTAGAFAYRAMFGGPTLPTLPPIIKAESGPTKIIPGGVGSQDGTAREPDANSAAPRERLVSREERPVDIPPPVTSTAPRPVSTVPVFPDPPRMGGPGAIVGYSPNAPSNNPATSVEPPAPTAPATTASAPNFAPSANQASPPSAAASVSTAAPAAPGPKKIRTVTIRTDQSGTPDAAGAPPSAATRQGTPSSQANSEPLSIVPSSTEGSAAPARPRTVPAQSVPLTKPAASETASAGPAAAPAATGGSYAVQISSQRSEEEAQSSFRDLQAKYPNLLGGRAPIIRRADLGAKGVYYRAMVGPFASADQAIELCSNLKAAGASCLVQKN